MNSTIPLTEYAIDLPGITSFGIDAWMEKFQPPFDQNKFQNVLDNISDAFADSMMLFESDDPVYIAGAINYKIVNIIAMWYYKYLCLVELKKQGCSSITGKGKIDDAINEKLNSSPLKGIFKRIKISQRLKERAYYARQNMEIHGVLSSAMGLCSGDCYVIGDPTEGLLKSYLENKHWKPVCLRALQFFPSGEPDLSDEDKKSLNKFFDNFYSELSDDSHFFNQQFQDDFRKIFVSTISIFNHIYKKLAGKQLKPLIVASIHFNYSRIVAAAWKAAGGSVTSVAHGNVYLTGAYGQPINNGTLLVCNRFLVASIGHKIQLEHARKTFPGKLLSDAEIILQGNQSLQKVYSKCKGCAPVEKIKKIMIVGYPMDYIYHPFLKGHETMTYTHMTVNILKALKKAGYYLIYKTHPDTTAETDGVFEKFVDEIIKEDFTEVYQQADCLFYISPYSTTFGFGALTNKPIVYVNHAGWKWHPDIFELLENRAVSFFVSFDDAGVIQIDNESLVKNIEESLSRTDHSVVDKYAFGG
jgi:hypothetical protein